VLSEKKERRGASVTRIRSLAGICSRENNRGAERRGGIVNFADDGRDKL